MSFVLETAVELLAEVEGVGLVEVIVTCVEVDCITDVEFWPDDWVGDGLEDSGACELVGAEVVSVNDDTVDALGSVVVNDGNPELVASCRLCRLAPSRPHTPNGNAHPNSVRVTI